MQARFVQRILVCHLLVSPLVFWPGTREVFELNKVHCLQLAALACAGCGLWCIATQRASWPRLCDGTALGVLAWLGSAALSTVFAWSPRTALRGAPESYAGLGTTAALAVLFFATRAAVRDAASARRLVAAPAAASLLVAAYALVQAAGLDPLRWERVASFAERARPFGTLGHPNVLGAYLAMVGPLGLVAWRRSAATLGVIAWLAGALAVIASLSRGAWLALAVATAVVTAAAWRRRDRPALRRLATAGAALASIVLVLALTLHAGSPAASSIAVGLRERLGALARPAAEPRLAIWGAALRMARLEPLVGVGLDGFQLGFQRVRAPANWRAEGAGTPTRAHDELLHVAATQGGVGVAALLLLALGLARDARDAWRRNRDGASADLTAALVACELAGVAALTTGFSAAATSVLFVTSAALVSRLARGDAPTGIAASARAPRAAGLAAALAGGVLVVGAAWWGVIQPWRASAASHEGESLLRAGDGVAALRAFARATALDPGDPLHWAGLGHTERALGLSEPDPARRRARLLAARIATQQAVALVPVNSYDHVNEARVLVDLARLDPPAASPEDALQAYDAALALDPAQRDFLAEAEEMALALARPEPARAYAARRRALEESARAGTLHH